MYGWLTFYHQGHEASKDCKPYMTDLQIRVQNVSSFNESSLLINSVSFLYRQEKTLNLVEMIFKH